MPTTHEAALKAIRAHQQPCRQAPPLLRRHNWASTPWSVKPQQHHPSRLLPTRAAAAAAASIPHAPAAGAEQAAGSWWEEQVKWWSIESPLPQEEGGTAGKRTDIRPLLSKLLELCSPDTLLMVGAAVFMVCAQQRLGGG